MRRDYTTTILQAGRFHDMPEDRYACITDPICANCGEGIRNDESIKINNKGEPEHAEGCAW